MGLGRGRGPTEPARAHGLVGLVMNNERAVGPAGAWAQRQVVVLEVVEGVELHLVHGALERGRLSLPVFGRWCPCCSLAMQPKRGCHGLDGGLDARGVELTRLPCVPGPPACRYNLLAIGTTDGRVMMYKYNHPNEASQPVLDFAKCWEMQPAFFVSCRTHLPSHPDPTTTTLSHAGTLVPVLASARQSLCGRRLWPHAAFPRSWWNGTCLQVGNRALTMEWGPFPRLMVVACNDAINVCRKTMLSFKYRDGVAIMQVSAACMGGWTFLAVVPQA